MKIIAYFLMLIFDLIIIAGTVWLIDQRDWSKWSMLLAILIIGGSYPGRFIK